ncbi:SDR family NAD(P)-dependent oxidoreductase [Sphingomonas bisphenolicum]|uniref:Ketoreductase domain-containing protein n=1 Tax=Sphingomonas bisphenolicum TaxID=296544 RepID=A0ABM7FXD4_9SPHN|nr:SDR family NAD(P)-dependent oxidoreductase [Sphingomonas bisphenolicum]BBF69795.1 hypothetical protein SBA_ch1_19950 [Sphingomonas bisphenolicum]
MKIDNFNDRVAVITGGAAGIGRALAELLQEGGATVVIADLPGETLDATALDLGITAIACDVSDATAMDSLAAQVMQRHGKVDLLFNNAGVGFQQSLYKMSLRDWRWVFDVNFWGVVHGLNSFLPHLTTNPDGAYVVNTASLLSLYTNSALAAYAASKYAVLAVTETLAREMELTDGKVGVTAFCPGPIQTTIYGSLDRRDQRYGPPPTSDATDDPVMKALGHIMDAKRMSARDAAQIALDAVRNGRFWAITHPEYTQQIAPEHDALMAEIERQRSSQALSKAPLA